MKHEPTGEIIDWRFSLLHPVLWYFPMELTGRGPVLLLAGWGGIGGVPEERAGEGRSHHGEALTYIQRTLKTNRASRPTAAEGSVYSRRSEGSFPSPPLHRRGAGGGRKPFDSDRLQRRNRVEGRKCSGSSARMGFFFFWRGTRPGCDQRRPTTTNEKAETA